MTLALALGFALASAVNAQDAATTGSNALFPIIRLNEVNAARAVLADGPWSWSAVFPALSPSRRLPLAPPLLLPAGSGPYRAPSFRLGGMSPFPSPKARVGWGSYRAPLAMSHWGADTAPPWVNSGWLGGRGMWRDAASWTSGPPHGASSLLTNRGNLATSLSNATCPAVCWEGGGSGNWSVPGNWTGDMSPTMSSNVYIEAIYNGNAPAKVTDDVDSASANNLTIDATSSLLIPNGSQLTIYGSSISNANKTGNGGIVIGSGSTGSGGELLIASPTVTLGGGGLLTMSSSASNIIEGSNSNDTLINEGTIQGQGIIGFGEMGLKNSGTIKANVSGGSLTISPNTGFTNSGTVEADSGSTLTISTASAGTTNSGTITANGGNLTIQSTTVTNTSTGVITSENYGDVFLAGTVTIAGGTLGPGTFTAQGLGTSTSVTLNGVTMPVSTHYTLTDGDTTTLTGSNVLNGTILLSSTGDATTLVISGNQTLNNFLVTTANSQNFITGSGTSNKLTIATDAELSASGTIGNCGCNLALVNSGLIYHGNSVGLLIATNNGFTNSGIVETYGSGALTIKNDAVGTTNTGTLEAGVTQTDGPVLPGELVLSGNTVDNSSGTKSGLILALGSSTVELENGVTIAGGYLTAYPSGLIVVPTANGATLNGVRLEGNLQMQDGSMLTLTGANNLADSTISLLGSANPTSLVIGGASETLAGTVTMSNYAHNQIYGSAAANTLINTGTIQGAGVIGGGSMALVNAGEILANQSAGLLINTSNGFTNKGLVEAQSGAKLTIQNDNSTVGTTNTDTGTIEATGAGSLLTLNSGSVTNQGKIAALNEGSVEVYQTTVNNAHGEIQAVGSGSSVTLENTTIDGGSLIGTGGGNIFTPASYSATLNGEPTGGLTVEGDYIGSNNSSTTLEGSIINSGKISLNSTGNDTFLFVGSSNVTLTGGGTVAMSNSPYNIIMASAPSATLVNDDTIEGAGKIGNGAALAVLNQGTILADQSTPLIINPATSFNNQGTVAANAGSTLDITGTNFLNFNSSTGTLTGGTYNVSGTLQFDNANIKTNHANITLNGSGAKIVNQSNANGLASFTTNTAGGSFTLLGGANLTTAGNFTNYGTLTVGASNSKFTVTGNLTNFNTTTHTLTGGVYSLTGTFQFNGANIITNAANITLNGTSSKIVNQSGSSGLANFSTNGPAGIFALAGGRDFTTSGNFTNHGILTVGSGSNFDVSGSLTNFSGTTLTGGTYNLNGGTLQFTGANVVTNAAHIILMGTTWKFLNQASASGLANLANNNAGASFNLIGGATFTTAGSFTNNGTLLVGTGSTFNVHGNLTNHAGTTTDDGTLTIPTADSLTVSGGSVLGQGTITGAVKSSSAGILLPGDSLTTTGILKETGAYTQNSGALDIVIKGTAAGSQYDQFNPTTANLSGTLNIMRSSSFVPAIGSTFKIMNFTSKTGTFGTVNGLAISSSEHFTLTYQPSDVLLTVASGAAPASRRSRNAPLALVLNNNPALGPAGMTLAQLITTDLGGGQSSQPQNFLPANVFPQTSLPQGSGTGTAGNATTGTGLSNSGNHSAAGLAQNASRASKMMVPMAFHVDALSLVQKGPRRYFRDLWKHPSSPDDINSGLLSIGWGQ